MRRFFKKRKTEVVGQAVPLPWKYILAFLQWPERLICERVCKEWRSILLPLKKQTQEQILSCFHKQWQNVRIMLPRFQSGVIPHGQGAHHQLFSLHHYTTVDEHVCGRALVIPHDRQGYKHTLKRLNVPREGCCVEGKDAIPMGSLLRRYTNSGVSLIVLPNEYHAGWKPLHLLKIVNSLVHLLMPTIKWTNAGVSHYAQPDIKDALLSFCCPCYIRYLCSCEFFWPHTRNDFKVLECCNKKRERQSTSRKTHH